MEVDLTVEESAEQLAAALRGRSFGATRIVGVEPRVDRDSEGEVAIFLNLTLSDPTAPTWAPDEIKALRRATFEAAAEIGSSVTVYLRLSPATDSPQDEEEPEPIRA